MTHSELFDGRAHTGVFRFECPGEVSHQGDFPEPTPPAAPVTTVSLYLCGLCGHMVSVTPTRVLNSYAPPPPREMAADLAGRLGLGPGKGV